MHRLPQRPGPGGRVEPGGRAGHALARLWLDSGAAANGTYAIMDAGTPERPSPLYVREMQRYGILPPDFDPAGDPFDPYATDEAYWRMFWHPNSMSDDVAPTCGQNQGAF